MGVYLYDGPLTCDYPFFIQKKYNVNKINFTGIPVFYFSVLVCFILLYKCNLQTGGD